MLEQLSWLHRVLFSICLEILKVKKVDKITILNSFYQYLDFLTGGHSEYFTISIHITIQIHK